MTLTDEKTGTFRIGEEGPTVRRLGFGAMRITGEGIWGDRRADRDAAHARSCAAPSSSA